MRKRVEVEQPEGPAIVGRDHVRDRVVSPVAGAARAWRKLSPLESAYARGQLAGGKHNASERFEAGQRLPVSLPPAKVRAGIPPS